MYLRALSGEFADATFAIAADTGDFTTGPALATLQHDEVAMVAADKECERHIQKVEDGVRAEYEVTFRDQNAGLLDKVVKP